MISQRLRQLRLARGLSLEALAEQMGGMVTKQALSKYETGKARPSMAVLTRLAASLGVKTAYLWSEPSVQVGFIAYRKGHRMNKKEQARVESVAMNALEDRVRLQELTQHESELPLKSLRIRRVEDAEGAAQELREQWLLGVDPIASVTGLLESHLIHVVEIESEDGFDGISAIAWGDGQPIAAAVVTRKALPGERQRLNLTHELGHIAIDVSDDVDEEKAAFRFGAAFLAPARTLRAEVGQKRAAIQLQELTLLKQRYGMSIQAMLYRLRDLEIISQPHYEYWCKEVNRHGWRKAEPSPLPAEEPQWLRQNTLRALSEKLISADEASRMLGEPVHVEEPISLVQRRKFLELPLEERQRLLAEQFASAAPYYERSAEWKDWEAM